MIRTKGLHKSCSGPKILRTSSERPRRLDSREPEPRAKHMHGCTLNSCVDVRGFGNHRGRITNGTPKVRWSVLLPRVPLQLAAEREFSLYSDGTKSIGD